MVGRMPNTFHLQNNRTTQELNTLHTSTENPHIRIMLSSFYLKIIAWTHKFNQIFLNFSQNWLPALWPEPPDTIK